MENVVDNFQFVFCLLQVVGVEPVYRNFTVAYLCCVGWLEVYGMIVPVKVGFLYMEVFMPVGGCVWTNFHYPECTNSSAQNAKRHMSHKLEEASIYDITSTNKPSGIIATHLAAQIT